MLACVEGNIVLPFQSNYHPSDEEVIFANLKQYYRHNETIVVEYTLGHKVRASSHDVVGMYPVGWQSLEQFVAFEAVIVRPAETHRRQRKVVFQPRYRVDRVQSGVEYMFLYVTTSDTLVLGASNTFMFLPDRVPECQPEYWQGYDEKQLKTGRPLRKSRDTVHSLPYLMDNMSAMPQYSSCSTSPQWVRSVPRYNMGPSSPMPVCMQCKCPINYARTQQNLHAKVRAISDELHEEQARVAALERQLELSRVAQSKLRLSAQFAAREKNVALTYLNSLLASHPPDSIVAPNPVPSPPTGVLTARERLFKAIIGTQEATIRDLVRRLATMNASSKSPKETDAQKSKVRVERLPEASTSSRARNQGKGKSASAKSVNQPVVDTVQPVADNQENAASPKSVNQPVVDTVQPVVIQSQIAQYGDREVLASSDDSDSSESRCTLNDGVVSPK